MRALASATAVSSAREMPPARSMTQDWPCLTIFTRSPTFRRAEAVASLRVTASALPSSSAVTFSPLIDCTAPYRTDAEAPEFDSRGAESQPLVKSPRSCFAAVSLDWTICITS